MLLLATFHCFTETLHSFSRLLFLIICTNLSVKIDVFHLKNQKAPWIWHTCLIIFIKGATDRGAGREVRCEEQVKADEVASRQMALLCICVLGALHLCKHSVLICINEVFPTCISLSLVCWSQRNTMKYETSRYEQNQPLWCCCCSLWSHFRVWVELRRHHVISDVFWAASFWFSGHTSSLTKYLHDIHRDKNIFRDDGVR